MDPEFGRNLDEILKVLLHKIWGRKFFLVPPIHLVDSFYLQLWLCENRLNVKLKCSPASIDLSLRLSKFSFPKP